MGLRKKHKETPQTPQEQASWRLVCSSDSHPEAISVPEESLELLSALSHRLDLVMSRDDQHKIISLCHARASKAERLEYPSGWIADCVPDALAGPKYQPAKSQTAAPLIPAIPDAQLSPHFRLSDFRPGPTGRRAKGYDYIRVSPELVQALEEIRARARRSITIAAGYRPPTYSLKKSGVPDSTHVNGLAADISCEGIALNKLYRICDKVIGARGGVGLYPEQGLVHVDLRGYATRWADLES